jgi:hypothetical protein
MWDQKGSTKKAQRYCDGGDLLQKHKRNGGTCNPRVHVTMACGVHARGRRLGDG